MVAVPRNIRDEEIQVSGEVHVYIGDIGFPNGLEPTFRLDKREREGSPATVQERVLKARPRHDVVKSMMTYATIDWSLKKNEQ